jgi:enoyl-CoA hydratase
MDAARKTASLILRKGPVAIRAAMEAINRGFDMNFDDACKLEASLFGIICATEDMKEGTSAFMEKRKPKFEGR